MRKRKQNPLEKYPDGMTLKDRIYEMNRKRLKKLRNENIDVIVTAIFMEFYIWRLLFFYPQDFFLFGYEYEIMLMVLASLLLISLIYTIIRKNKNEKYMIKLNFASEMNKNKEV